MAPGKVVILAAKRGAPAAAAATSQPPASRQQAQAQLQPALPAAQAPAPSRGKKRKAAAAVDAGAAGRSGIEVQGAAGALTGPDESKASRRRKTQADSAGLEQQQKHGGSDAKEREVAAAGQQPASKVKWAKLIRSLLEAAPKRRLTLRKLRKRLHAVTEVAAACTDAQQLEKRVMRKVASRSELFAMEGGIVRLVAA